MSTASPDTTFSATTCTTLETASTAFEPTTSTQDIVSYMLHKCSPELVYYIFSFTTSDHASAAGLFKLSLSLFQDSSLEPSLDTDFLTPPLRHAMWAGDLPLVCYIIFENQQPRSIISEEFLHNYEDTNIHTYMYLFYLIDCEASPLRDLRAVFDELLMDFFDSLRIWATKKNNIYLLETLYQSRFSRSKNLSFADWEIVAEKRLINILEHANEHGYLGFHNYDNSIMYKMLYLKWGAGLEFCHITSGTGFQLWDFTALEILLDPRNSEVRAVMYKFCILPQDICLRCKDYWLPRIGYWGLVEAHAQSRHTRSHTHACSDLHKVLTSDDTAYRIGKSGLEYGDMRALLYLIQYGSNSLRLWSFFSLVKKGEVKILLLAIYVLLTTIVGESLVGKRC